MTSGTPNSSGSPPKPWEKAMEGLHSSSGEKGTPPPGGKQNAGIKPEMNSQPTRGAATTAKSRTKSKPQAAYNPTAPPAAAPRTMPVAGRTTGVPTAGIGTNPAYYNNPGLTQRGTYGRSGYGLNYGGYGQYRQPYSSYGGGYGGYGSTRPYSSLLGNAAGQPPPGQGEFANRAQRGVEPAFRSIENIVRACASISNLMESTLGSVHMSFTALIDVVEHFGHVRSTLTDNRFWRFIALLWRKFVNFLLRRRSMEEAWAQTEPVVTGVAAGRSRSWPLLIFLSIVMGGPFFIWSMFRGTANDMAESASAAAAVDAPPNAQVQPLLQREPKLPGHPSIRQVLFPWTPTKPDELNAAAGDVVIVQAKNQQGTWFYAKLMRTGQVGWIPSNYTGSPPQAHS